MVEDSGCGDHTYVVSKNVSEWSGYGKARIHSTSNVDTILFVIRRFSRLSLTVVNSNFLVYIVWKMRAFKLEDLFSLLSWTNEKFWISNVSTNQKLFILDNKCTCRSAQTDINWFIFNFNQIWNLWFHWWFYFLFRWLCNTAFNFKRSSRYKQRVSFNLRTLIFWNL